MSQSVLDPPMTDLANSMSESSNSSWANDVAFHEFDYTPVSPWGPVALVLGIASLTALMNNPFGLFIAFVGVALGITAFFKVRAQGPHVKGTGFAIAGVVLSFLCLSLGSAKMVHAFQNECPEGYRRTNFPNEISKHEFVYFGTRRRLSPEVAPLIGQKLFLKGYMWQTQKSEGLTEFVFLKDNGDCCFGGEPKPFDMMVVKMVEGTTRSYEGRMVSVAGVLSANVQAGEGEPVYTVDATVVEEAQTQFSENPISFLNWFKEETLRMEFGKFKN